MRHESADGRGALKAQFRQGVELPITKRRFATIGIALLCNARVCGRGRLERKTPPPHSFGAPMTSMKHVQFTATIAAPAAVVWHHITSSESYRNWTSVFAEGSHFKGSWEQGAKILFLSPSGDGMVSQIAESRTNEFVSIRHLGYVTQGVEDTESEAVRAWAPAYENYTLLSVPEGTKLVVDQDVAPDWEEHLAHAWPKALERLKTLSEPTSSAPPVG